MKEAKLLKEELRVEHPKCKWSYKDCGYARELFECESNEEKLLFCANCQLADLSHEVEKLNEGISAFLETRRE